MVDTTTVVATVVVVDTIVGAIKHSRRWGREGIASRSFKESLQESESSVVPGLGFESCPIPKILPIFYLLMFCFHLFRDRTLEDQLLCDLTPPSRYSYS